MPTIPERLTALEKGQEAHEKANDLAIEDLKEKIGSVEVVAMEAREMVTQTNTLVAQMPQKIIEAIDARNKGKRMEARDWVNVLSALVVASVAIIALWPHK